MRQFSLYRYIKKIQNIFFFKSDPRNLKAFCFLLWTCPVSINRAIGWLLCMYSDYYINQCIILPILMCTYFINIRPKILIYKFYFYQGLKINIYYFLRCHLWRIDVCYVVIVFFLYMANTYMPWKYYTHNMYLVVTAECWRNTCTVKHRI